MQKKSRKFQHPSSISPNIFRAYDIRGIVNDTLTADAVYAIGRAFGREAQTLNEKSVVIARDGRL